MNKKLPAPEYDFELIGIACHEKDYRLCHELNVNLSLELARQDDLTTCLNKIKETSSHSMFAYVNENGVSYYIIANKGTNGFLIPEQKQLDFFLLLKGPMFEEDKKDLIALIKQIPVVIGVYEIDPDDLKSKDNLIF